MMERGRGSGLCVDWIASDVGSKQQIKKTANQGGKHIKGGEAQRPFLKTACEEEGTKGSKTNEKTAKLKQYAKEEKAMVNDPGEGEHATER
jgi:hypothetical protein